MFINYFHNTSLVYYNNLWFSDHSLFYFFYYNIIICIYRIFLFWYSTKGKNLKKNLLIQYVTINHPYSFLISLIQQSDLLLKYVQLFRIIIKLTYILWNNTHCSDVYYNILDFEIKTLLCTNIHTCNNRHDEYATTRAKRVLALNGKRNRKKIKGSTNVYNVNRDKKELV